MCNIIKAAMYDVCSLCELGIGLDFSRPRMYEC